MTDTLRIERPLFCRRMEDRGGRLRRDLQGNTVRVKTRIHDSSEDALIPLDAETGGSDRAAASREVLETS